MAARSMVRMPPDSCTAGPPVVATGSVAGEELNGAWGGRAMAPYMDGLAGGVKRCATAASAPDRIRLAVWMKIRQCRSLRAAGQRPSGQRFLKAAHRAVMASAGEQQKLQTALSHHQNGNIDEAARLYRELIAANSR